MKPSEIVNGIGQTILEHTHGENVLLSPVSLMRDLAMLAGGTDMLTDGGRRLMEALQASDLEDVRRLVKAAQHRVDPYWEGGVELSFSDLILVNLRHARSVSEGYRRWVDSLGGAAIEAFDLDRELDAAEDAVSSWASDATEGHMGAYAPGIDPSVDMALYDSIHLKGRWLHMFDPARTHSRRFTLADSTKTDVMMMRMQKRFRYHEDGTFKAVALELQGSVAFCIVIPMNGRPDIALRWPSVDRGYRMGFIDALMDSSYVDVVLSFPRTEVCSEIDLTDILDALGISGGVVLPDIVDRPLVLGSGRHTVRLSIDEEGLEASGITMNGMFGCVPPEEPLRFNCNIPFMFYLRGEDSGMDLFSGYVGDPNGSRPTERRDRASRSSVKRTSETGPFLRAPTVSGSILSANSPLHSKTTECSLVPSF